MNSISSFHISYFNLPKVFPDQVSSWRSGCIASLKIPSSLIVVSVAAVFATVVIGLQRVFHDQQGRIADLEDQVTKAKKEIKVHEEQNKFLQDRLTQLTKTIRDLSQTHVDLQEQVAQEHESRETKKSCVQEFIQSLHPHVVERKEVCAALVELGLNLETIPPAWMRVIGSFRMVNPHISMYEIAQLLFSYERLKVGIEENGKVSRKRQTPELSRSILIFGEGSTKRFIAKCSREKDPVLGRGAAKTVWSGVDLETGEIVALGISKAIPGKVDYTPHTQAEAEYLRLFQHDRRFVSLLGTIAVSGEKGRKIYLAMQRCVGDLFEYLDRPRSFEENLKIALEIAGGIKELHDCDVVHGDIKAENILFDAQGRHFVIADLGLTASSDDPLVWSRGTVYYHSPEYARARNAYFNKISSLPVAGKPGEIWTLGCLFFELFSESRQQPAWIANVHLAPQTTDRFLHRLDALTSEEIRIECEKLPRQIQLLLKGMWDLNPETRWSIERVFQFFNELDV